LKVSIERLSEDHPMSHAQFVSVKALIAAVEERIGPAEEEWPVFLDSTWAQVYGVPLDSVVVFDDAEPSAG